MPRLCTRCGREKGDQQRADRLPIARRWLNVNSTRRPTWPAVLAAQAADQPGVCLEGMCEAVDWRALTFAGRTQVAELTAELAVSREEAARNARGRADWEQTAAELRADLISARAEAAASKELALEAIDALDESVEHTALVAALRVRLAASDGAGWTVYDTTTVLADGPILVYLADDLLQSRIHTARVVRGKVLTVASTFYYDAPPIIYWRPMLAGPAVAKDHK